MTPARVVAAEDVALCTCTPEDNCQRCRAPKPPTLAHLRADVEDLARQCEAHRQRLALLVALVAGISEALPDGSTMTGDEVRALLMPLEVIAGKGVHHG